MSDMRAKATVVKHNATRQFRHNDDNSPNPFQPEGGFVFAYDLLIIDKFLAELLKKVDELESKLDYPHEEIREMQAKLDEVRGFSTSHIHLKDGETFIKVRRDVYLKALGEDK